LIFIIYNILNNLLVDYDGSKPPPIIMSGPEILTALVGVGNIVGGNE
jgi:hypothetical protein